jgi:hypothetical protein
LVERLEYACDDAAVVANQAPVDGAFVLVVFVSAVVCYDSDCG